VGFGAKKIIVRELNENTGRNGDLFARWWIPENVLGCVVIVHGLGEHGGRYEGIAQRLGGAGWATLVADLRGHGRSPGRRGHASRYVDWLQDIEAMRLTAAERFPHVPQVLLGHSMGGNLATNYVLRRTELHKPLPPPVGLVLSGPMFLPFNPPTRPQIFAAWATGYVVPWLTIRAPVDTSKLSRNPETVNELRSDPLCHNRLSVYLGTQLLAQGRYALDHAKELTVPTLLMHGEDDPITSFRATESFAIRAGDVATFVNFPKMLHEIFNETEAEVVFQTLVHWLERFK